MKISKEARFSVPAESFSIAGTDSGYTLMYGTDGTFASWEEATPAGEPAFVVNVPKFSTFYLSGNTQDDVKITF